VSNNGTVLNVIDQGTRIITRYPIPFSPTALGTLGPTATNFLGQGDPVSGGFDLGDVHIAIGDAQDWVDIGSVATNKFKAVANIDYYFPQGAAYVPSDK
jgi:hypothetical protein